MLQFCVCAIHPTKEYHVKIDVVPSTTKILVVMSVPTTTCFGHTDRHQAFKYMILK